jgi:NADH:ubiquinone oxidoreductase subunit 2 (subunit N)
VKPYILKETGLLVLLSTAGILLMASSTNFISFYLALELISLASYILVSTTITDCEQTKKEITSTEQPWEVTPNTPKPKEPNKLKNSYVSLLVYADNSIVAGLNYFLLSALSSGLLILGISLIYYTTGELDFNSLARIFSSNSVHVESTINGGFLPQSHCTHLPQPSVESGIGMCLVMTFVLFKLGASPFHYWVADVYEKVSIFVNYFLIVVAKLAMLFALMKLSFGMNLPLVENLLIVAAVSSLLIGSFAGLVQTKLRRLMAFSSINHVGYILLAYSFSLTKKVFEPESFSGVSDCDWERNQLLGLDQGSMIITEFSKLSIASLWLYVTIYSLSTVCFFAILSLAVENGKQDHKSVNLSTNLTLQKLNTFAIFNVKGGGASHEVYALSQESNIPSPIFITASFTITLLSLAGVPPLAGFIAKIAIFWQVLDSGNWFLATIAVLCSVIAAIYYLRIVALLYFHAAHPGVAVVTDPKKHSLNDSAAANATHSKQTTTPTESLDVKALPSSVNITFLTALIIASITIIIVVFPILNPSFMYLYMING